MMALDAVIASGAKQSTGRNETGLLVGTLLAMTNFQILRTK
jgi:hypothetical protein